MADVKGNPMSEESPVVAETVVDIPETIIDDDFRPIMVSGDITFDANAVFAGEGRMAACVSSETFAIHTDEVIGSGSQGMVVRATDSSGAEYAAKISYPIATARDRRNRKAVLESLVSLMDEHPLGRNHFKQTRLMPLYAYGKITGPAGSGSPEYNVAIMALCDSSLGDGHGCSYDEIRRTVLPQAADGLRALHAQGIVHRDIKPKNLYMLDGTIVLGDYGISSLLDEGKDTGATVFDKRTPGYSPHSSVVQRENDWYALGYTIWTLYNHGEHPHQALIDAGDLSAVLAGKRPVEFIPNSPSESTLGDLIYGLTLEAPRGRLGYKDIQEWLDDPASFRFESPFDVAESARTYQFRGHSYSDNGELADAMAEHWSDASEHIQSEALEDFLKSSGQQDLAVRVHRALSEAQAWGDMDFGIASVITVLKRSPEEFVWKGHWHRRAAIADESFARLTTEPYAMYEYASDPDRVRELLRFLLVAYAGEQAFARDEAVVRAAYAGIPGLEDSDIILRVDGLLVMFEELCDDKVSVRRFFTEYGPFGDSVWVKQHIASYSGTTKDAKRAIGRVRDARLPSPESESLEQARSMLRTLDEYVAGLSAILPTNPYIKMLGLEQEASVTIKTDIAYRVATAYGERCTIGYAMSVVSPAARDEVCDFAALRESAVRKAREAAGRIRRSAEASGSSQVAGHSRVWHVALMACTLAVLLFVWNSFGALQQDYLTGFKAYAPVMEEAGGFVPDAWFAKVAVPGEASAADEANSRSPVAYDLAPAAIPPEGYVAEETAPASVALVFPDESASVPLNSCTFGLDMALFGFTIAALCVLAWRILELIPPLLSSSMRNRKLRNAEKLEADAGKLGEMTLAHSVEMLFEDRRMSSERSVLLLELPTDDRNTVWKAAQWANRCYKLAIIMLIAGIVLATVTWVPLGFGHLTAAQIQSLQPGEVLFGQGSLLFTLAVFYAIVFRVGGTRPNMLVVIFLSLPLPFFAWFSLGSMFGFLQLGLL